MDANDKFLTADELAEILPIAKATIYARVRARQLPHYRFGDRIVFRLSEVLALAHVPADTEDFGDLKTAGAGR